MVFYYLSRDFKKKRKKTLQKKSEKFKSAKTLNFLSHLIRYESSNAFIFQSDSTKHRNKQNHLKYLRFSSSMHLTQHLFALFIRLYALCIDSCKYCTLTQTYSIGFFAHNRYIFWHICAHTIMTN